MCSSDLNDIIARVVACFPDRFRGVAGLPQFMHESPAERCVAELERCVEQLGFVGCLINPDPTEGSELPPPGLGDAFWHPLYAAMERLDVEMAKAELANGQNVDAKTLAQQIITAQQGEIDQMQKMLAGNP